MIDLLEVWRLAPFLAAVLVLELTPGPNMAYLALVGAERGWRAGLVTVVGVTAGLLVWLLASIGGLVELAAARPGLLLTLKWAGVAYLAWLSFETWREAGLETRSSRPVAGSLLARGFLTNIPNPKAALLYVSLIPAFISREPTALPAAVFTLGLIHIAVSVVVHCLIVVGASVSRRGLHAGSSGQSKTLGRVFAGALALVAIWMAFATP